MPDEIWYAFIFMYISFNKQWAVPIILFGLIGMLMKI